MGVGGWALVQGVCRCVVCVHVCVMCMQTKLMSDLHVTMTIKSK